MEEIKVKEARMTLERSRGTERSDDNLVPIPAALADVEAGGMQADGIEVSEAAEMFRPPGLLARRLPL